MALPSVDDLKPHLTAGGNDLEMESVLAAAVDLVASRVGPLEPVPVIEQQAVHAQSTLVLRRAPVAAVASIVLGGAVVPSEDYFVDNAAGLVVAAAGRAFHGDYVVTYSAGREELPHALRFAVLIIAAHLWETQRVPGRAGVMGQQTAAAAATVPMGFAVPNRAATLMAPYQLPALA